jgi:hypothetical protein
VDNVVKVFFSYKKVDERAATTIVEALNENAADKLDITYMAGFTEQFAGQRWRDQISKGVRSANWFILLLPDPSDELDWCLFETGLFEAQLLRRPADLCTIPTPKSRIDPGLSGDRGDAAGGREIPAHDAVGEDGSRAASHQQQDRETHPGIGPACDRCHPCSETQAEP